MTPLQHYKLSGFSLPRTPPGVVLDLGEQQQALQGQHHAERGAAHVGALEVDHRDGDLEGFWGEGGRRLRAGDRMWRLWRGPP